MGDEGTPYITASGLPPEPITRLWKCVCPYCERDAFWVRERNNGASYHCFACQQSGSSLADVRKNLGVQLLKVVGAKGDHEPAPYLSTWTEPGSENE